MERDGPGDRRGPVEPPMTAPAIDPYRLIEENLRRAMEFYGRSREGAEIRRLAGLEIVCSGTNMAMFNAALLTEPVEGNDRDLDLRISMAAVHFGELGVRWSCWLCEDMLSRSLRRSAPDIFARRGMRRVVTVPGMVADRLREPVHSLPAIECRPVQDIATRQAFGYITAISFGLPYDAASGLYEPEGVWQGDFAGFVGYANGEPVCTAGTVRSQDVIGFYSIGTLPHMRRRGYAEALMRRAFDIARGDTNIHRAVLQSTAAGERLYAQLGFRQVTRFSIYVSP